MKRCISMLLVLALVFTMIPNQAIAVTPTTEANMDTGEVTVEGTNGFGTLLSQEIQDSQEESASAEEDYEAGYSIVDLTFEGDLATVEYSSLEEAILVVALYSEDGLQMLASGQVQVSPDEETAYVTIEGDMPEYFLASAYLVDTYDLSPLCAAYDTPMYTQEMQELLASTIHDYDADRVLNLDEDETTNFAVYAENTIVIEAQAGVNNVASVDDENFTYVIENADESITSLVEGDVFVYLYGKNEILIVKVASIQVNGNTVTIIGSEDLETKEVFSHVKIEGKGNNSNLTIDASNATEGIKYEESSGGITPYGLAPRKTESSEVSASVGIVLDDIKLGGENAKIELTGGLELNITIAIEYYISMSYQRLDISKEVSLEGTFGVSGALEFPLNLGSFNFEAIPGVLQFGASVCFVTKIEAGIEASLTLSLKSGIIIEHGKQGFHHKKYCTPDAKMEVTFEGKLFMGLEVELSAKILYGALAEQKLTAEGGIEYTLERKLYPEKSEDEHHLCDTCFSGEAKRIFSLECSAKFLKMEKLAIKVKMVELTTKMYDIYYTPGEMLFFQEGQCPNLAYKLTVNVVDANDNPVMDASVSVGEFKACTGPKGIVTPFLPVAEYEITVQHGDITRQHTLYLDSAQKIKVKMSPDGAVENIFGSIIPEDCIDQTTYIASGQCGSNVYWALSDEGILSIAGNGDMWGGCRWYSYCDNINSVIIGNSVTTIGSNTFSGCTSLTSVTIPDSVTTIGGSAFEDCTSLTSVAIPDSVTTIGSNTFSGCTSLTSVTIPDSVTTIGGSAFEDCTSLTSVAIPDSVTTIGSYTFSGCTSLTSVTIPDSVTTIGDSAFNSCTNLVSVTLPDALTTIARETFNDCVKLTNVEIPRSVTTIDYYAFAHCASLTTVMIPSSVTTISSYAFADCDSLNSAKFPDSVTTIGEHAFYDCDSLTSVELPDSLTTISSGTFMACNSLTSVTIPDSVTTIGGSAFEDCTSLTSVTIPDSVTTIGDSAFKHCTSLTSVTIPDSVTTIGPWAFSGCNSLASVTIPDSITIIGGCVFSYSGLTTVEIPDSVTIIGDNAFANCAKLVSVIIPDSVTTISYDAFWNCANLTSVAIPDSVTTIGDCAFYADIALAEIVFYGDAPSIGRDVFAHVPATAYYPAGNSTWTSDVMEAFCGYITWIPYTLDENGNMVTNETAAITVTADTEQLSGVTETTDTLYENTIEDVPTVYAVHGGEYSSVVTDIYTLKTASFSSLVPGEQYVLLAMVSIDVEDSLAADNLLYIDQAEALEDGTLVFQYVQRTPTETSYVVACGTSSKNLNDAEITFPEMVVDSESIVVNPTVVYDGETLIEGQDYTIRGTVSVIEPGTYTCYIRGIRNYAGMVACTYEVISPYYEVASGTCGSNLTWTYYDNGRLTISGTGPMTEFDSYSSVPWDDRRSSIVTVIINEGVTTICDFAFAECANLTSATIGKSVTNIGDLAFSECSSLASITIPDSVTTIGSLAFSDCSSLASVKIGNSVTTIGSQAFRYCDKLTSVTIPDSVTTISFSAFEYCSSLASVTIGHSVTTIGNGAFRSCTSLSSMTIPESVTTIGNYAFYYCTNLTGIYVDENNPNYSSDDRGVLFDKEKAELILAPGAISGSYEIPDSVTTIRFNAFYYCANLTGVTIGESVTAIGSDAFGYCTNLTSVTIPESVATIGSGAFKFCTNLASVTIPESMTTIGDWAFYSCTSLTSVTIPGSVITIGNDVFSSCTSLTGIYVDENNPNYSSDGRGVLFDKEKVELIQAPGAISGSYEIPDSVTNIWDSAFYKCNDLNSVIIGNGVINIGDYAFHVCENLYEIIFNGNAPVFGSYAFNDVIAIVYYPASNSTWTEDVLQNYGGTITWVCNCTEHSYEAIVTEPTCIEQGYTTYTCSKCGDSYVADETEALGHNYVDGICTSCGAENPNWGAPELSGTCGENLTWTLVNGVLTISGMGPMTEYYNSNSVPWYGNRSIITDVNIENGVTTIGACAFFYFLNLNRVTIPDSVTTIGDYAFAYCDSLRSVTIPDSVTTICDSAFNSCKSLSSVAIPDSVITIGYDAFASCDSLRSVIVPDSITTISDATFWECTKLSSVTIPNSITTIGSSAFRGCTSLSNITIPNSVTTIEYGAFESCVSLSSVTIPDSVTYIDGYVFANCDGLTGIYVDEDNSYYSNDSAGVLYNKQQTALIQAPGAISGAYSLPDGVTTIDGCAFEGCSSLRSVTIPDSATTIGYSAFNGCTSLRSVSIPDSVTTIDSCVFEGCSSLGSVTIPDSATTIGYSAFNGCASLRSVSIPDSVTAIGEYTFSGCSSLSNLIIPDSVTTIGNDAFANCDGLVSITIPDSLTTIEEGTFSGCSSLSHLIIPDSVTTIESSAFYDCDGLIDVMIPDNVTTIGSSAFYDCDGLVSVTIGDGVTTIEDNTFLNCSNLSSVSIGNNVTSINRGAFKYCISLRSVSIPDSVTTIDSCVFEGCSSLRSATIPDSVTTIGSSAFYDCDGLVSVSIPDSVTAIGEYTFSNCSNLSSVSIGNNVTSINRGAFEHCISLSSVAIPESVVSIGDSAFHNCKNLNEIVFGGNVPSFGSGVFKYVIATACYPTNNPTWTEDVCQNYGGTITWEAYTSQCSDHSHSRYGADEDTHWSICSCGEPIDGTRSSHEYIDGKCVCGAIWVEVKTNADVFCTVNGQTVTIEHNIPCRVGYWDETSGKYVAITAISHGDGSYSFTAPEGVTEVLAVVTGDANGDGRVSASDTARLNAYILGKATLSAEELLAADVNYDGLANADDRTCLSNAILGKDALAWEVV